MQLSAGLASQEAPTVSSRLPSKHSVPVTGTRTFQGSYLVDPASSHMLVSKIKPCMSKYKLLIL